MDPKIAFAVGFSCLLVTPVLVYFALQKRKLIEAITATPTTSIGRIRGPGYYEVKGQVVCEHPLVAPGSGKECVYYRLVVKDRVEESYRRSDGEWDTRTSWKTVTDEERSCTFQIEDGTGSIGVLPTGASFEGSQQHRQRDHADTSMRAEMGAMLHYRTREHQGGSTEVDGILVGQRIYAIGRVVKLRNGLFLQRDEQEGKPFVLSLRSEDEQVASHTTWLTVQAIAATLLGLGGLFLLLYGFTRM